MMPRPTGSTRTVPIFPYTTRVRSLPPKRITVNLSPADLPKEGSHYDLPIALALLGAMGVIDPETLGSYVVVGELGLDGRVAPSSQEHTSELQSLMRISYAVSCLKNKNHFSHVSFHYTILKHH